MDSWKRYGDTLSQPLRDGFFHMLSGLQTYKERADTEGQQYAAESLFMALIIQQQEMISASLQELQEISRQRAPDPQSTR